MKTFLKIMITAFAVFMINTAFSQNALQKKSISKAEPASAKSASPALQKNAGNDPTSTTVSETRQASPELKQQSQPATKQAQQGKAKTPAQMAKKPLKKQVINKTEKASGTRNNK